jgi:hypothetical protein
MTTSFIKSGFWSPLTFICPIDFTGEDFIHRVSGTYNLLGGLDRTLAYSPISISFGQKTLRGSTVCSDYTADYRLENKTSIKIFNLVVIKKDYPQPDPASEQREAEYFNTITKVTKYILVNKSYMMLSDDSNQPRINLIFRK